MSAPDGQALPGGAGLSHSMSFDAVVIQAFFLLFFPFYRFLFVSAGFDEPREPKAQAKHFLAFEHSTELLMNCRDCLPPFQWHRSGFPFEHSKSKEFYNSVRP